MHSRALGFVPRSHRHIAKDRNSSLLPEQLLSKQDCGQQEEAFLERQVQKLLCYGSCCCVLEASLGASVMGRKRKPKEDWVLSLQDWGTGAPADSGASC